MRYIELSSDHLTEKATASLKRTAHSPDDKGAIKDLEVRQLPCGSFVTNIKGPNMGRQPALRRLVGFARQLQCDVILFTRNGYKHPQYKTYPRTGVTS